MQVDSRFQVTIARALLWLLVGVGAAVLVATLVPASAPSVAAAQETPVVWIGLAGLVAFLAVVSFELAKGVRLAFLRWVIFAATLIGAALLGSALVPALVSMAMPLAVASIVALVLLTFVGGGGAARGSSYAAPVSRARMGGPWFGGFRIAGLALVIGLVCGVGLVELAVARGPRGGSEPVRPPKTVAAVTAEVSYGKGTLVTHDAFKVKQHTLATADDAAEAVHDVLYIDGDRSSTRGIDMVEGVTQPTNGTYVLFDHKSHVERLGQKTSCIKCHHRNVALDRSTSCTTCHTYMYRASDTFDHAFHVQQYGGNASCERCHPADAPARTAEHSKKCTDCHGPGEGEATLVKVTLDLPTGHAAGYVDAMHGLCIGCHLAEEVRTRAEQPYLSRCVNCHTERPSGAGKGDLPEPTTIASSPGSPALTPVGTIVPEAR